MNDHSDLRVHTEILAVKDEQTREALLGLWLMIKEVWDERL